MGPRLYGLMVLHRAHTMAASYNHFTCRTYKKEGAEVCTAHYIREQILDEVVLEDIRRLHAMGLYGAIIGKAYYAGTIDLSAAAAEAGAQL